MVFSKLVLSAALLLTSTLGHGRLTVPTTRLGNPTQYENDPIGFQGRPMSQFVCRNPVNSAVAPATVTPGQQTTLKWLLSADHVGDAAIYISYDHAVSDVTDMEWFKIANIPDAKKYDEQNYSINVPDWLPAGRAVLRWEWYALHVRPTIELYAQCSPITVTNTGSGKQKAVSDIAKFKVYGNGAPLTQATAMSAAFPYRDAFAPNNGNQFMTGPACAEGSTLNECARTAEGTPGHIKMSGFTPSPPSPTMSPVPTPTDAPMTTTPAPVQPTQPSTTAPTAEPSTPAPSDSTPAPSTNTDGCVDEAILEYSQCGGEGFTGSGCCPSGTTCQWYTKWWAGCRSQACPAGWLCNPPQ